MREIAFMWIAAIVGSLVGFVVGKYSARTKYLDPGVYGARPRQKAPGAASEPEETTPVLATMSAWDATRDDEQRQDAVRGKQSATKRTFAGPGGKSYVLDPPIIWTEEPIPQAERLPPADEAKIIREMWPETRGETFDAGVFGGPDSPENKRIVETMVRNLTAKPERPPIILPTIEEIRSEQERRRAGQGTAPAR